MEKESKKRKTIDKKSWDCYTEEEKVDLLNHWWFYFGKMMFTMQEYSKFLKLIESTPDTVWDIAILSFSQNMTTQPLISAMRQNELAKLIISSCAVVKKIKALSPEGWSSLEDCLLDNLVPTYNDPEPSIPFTDEEKRRQLESITGVKNPTVITIDTDELGSTNVLRVRTLHKSSSF